MGRKKLREPHRSTIIEEYVQVLFSLTKVFSLIFSCFRLRHSNLNYSAIAMEIGKTQLPKSVPAKKQTTML